MMKTENNKQSRKRIFLRFSGYLLPYKGKVALMLFLIWIITLLGMVNPLLTKVLVDDVYKNKDMKLFLLLILVGVSLYFLKTGLGIAQSYLATYINERVTFDLRSKFYEHLHRLSLRFFEQRHTGEHMYRSINDVNAVVSMVTNAVPTLITTTLEFIIMLALTSWLNWRMTLIAISMVPLMYLNTYIASSKLRKLNIIKQNLLSNINGMLQQSISGVRVVKAFGREKHEVKKYVGKLIQNVRVNMTSWRLSAFYGFFGGMATTAGTSWLLWYGWYQVLKGNMTLGGLMAISMYIFRLYRPLQSYGGLYHSIVVNLVSAERIMETLGVSPQIVDTKDSVDLSDVKGEVKFEHVSFGYEKGQAILTDISFEARPGVVVGIVGPNGAGKTTVANLLMRFYDVDKGAVLLDAHDIKQVKLRSLRKHVAIVPQEIFLFPGTIRENILYGKRDATEREIHQAAEMADAHQFIMSLKEGYDTHLGERGLTLSTGQKQKIAIARAIIRNPKILILDEATSYLDTKSEAKVQEALNIMAGQRTVFIIAHRFSGIRYADVILVLDKGEIIESGTHEQLMKNGRLYHALYSTQT